MTSEFSDIYSRFLLRVKDYEFSGFDENLAQEMMNGWIKATLSRPFVRRIFSSLTVDEDSEMIEFELANPIDDDSDLDFVTEIIVQGMVVNWLSPQYYSVLNTAQFFSNSEQKFYSQANHMSELREMYHNAQVELRKMIRDRGYAWNNYLATEETESTS